MIVRVLRSLAQTAWQFKWWWIPPVSLLVVAFLGIVLFANATDDSPFRYILF